MNVYTLYRIRGKLTANGKGYYSHTPIYMVAAESLDDAMALTRAGEYYDGEAGILEEIIGDRVRDYRGQIGKKIGFFPGKVRRLTKKEVNSLRGQETNHVGSKGS